MIDEKLLRSAAREVLVGEMPPPSPGFEARVISALAEWPAARRAHRDREASFEAPPWLMTAAAIVLALAVVAGMLAWPRVAPRQAPAQNPAQTPETGVVETESRIPASSSRIYPSLQFFTPDTGWMTVTRDGNNTSLYKTVDGGTTWAGPQLAWKGGQQMRGMRFFNPREGIVFSYSKPVGLWRTEDGGAHWDTVATPIDPGYVDGWDFISAREGWLRFSVDPQQTPLPGGGYHVTEPYLAHTTDRGVHWNIFAADTLKAPNLRFLDSTNGFAILGGATPAVFRSRDGGSTWVPVGLAIPDDALPAEYRDIRPPGFFNSRDGVMLMVVQNRAYVYSTSDGGNTWSAGRPVPGSEGRDQALVSFANHEGWWAITGGRLRTTADAGTTWVPAAGALPGDGATELEAVDANRAWIRTRSGQVFRTADRGVTWQQIEIPPGR